MAEKIKSLFKSLLRELEILHTDYAAKESEKVKAGDYDAAQALISDLKTIADYRAKVDELAKNWQLKTSVLSNRKDAEQINRAEPLRMPHFKRPILEALCELGGKAKSKDVLVLVEQKIGNKFTEADKELDKQKSPKWQKTANFERLNLKHEGLISAPDRGIWEITEQGLAWLKSKEAEQLKQ